MVKSQVLEAFGSESAVDIEAAKGSVVLYITFNEEFDVKELVDSLLQKGAQVTLIQREQGQMGIMAPVLTGETLSHALKALFQELAYQQLGGQMHLDSCIILVTWVTI